jgi:hypothetical protein
MCDRPTNDVKICHKDASRQSGACSVPWLTNKLWQAVSSMDSTVLPGSGLNCIMQNSGAMSPMRRLEEDNFWLYVTNIRSASQVCRG